MPCMCHIYFVWAFLGGHATTKPSSTKMHNTSVNTDVSHTYMYRVVVVHIKLTYSTVNQAIVEVTQTKHSSANRMVL